MDELIQTMRADFSRLAAFRIDNGEWQAADAQEIGLTIRAVVAGKDLALVEQWARWCAAEVATYFGPTPIRPVVGPRSCPTCIHLTRRGYCDQRPDLPRAYGANHPLNCLPSDNGASCAAWRDQ